MFRAISRLAARRSRLALILVLGTVPILAIAGSGVKDALSVGGFVDPAAESAIVADTLEQHFGTAAPNYVLVATPRSGSASDAANEAAGAALATQLAGEPGVVDVVSAWTLGGLPEDTRNPLLSRDGNKGVLAMRLGGDEDAQRDTAIHLGELVADNVDFELVATGPAAVSLEAAEQAEADLLRAELIAAPLTLIGLLLVFRGWRASLIPLFVAALAVLGTFVALKVIASFATVSIFALNLTTALGLGLAIDYSLLIVSRFREERTAGFDVEAAVQRSVHTAGRTVLYSAITVAVSLLSLLVFPVAYLRSFAFAGVAVVIIAGVAASVVVPILLGRFGHLLGQARVTERRGFWARQAERVMRRPLLWALAVTAVLVVVGLPFRSVQPGRVDDRVLPASAEAREGADLLRHEFYIVDFSPISVYTPWIDPTDAEAVTDMVVALANVKHIHRVGSVEGFSSVVSVTQPFEYNDRYWPTDRAADVGTWFELFATVESDTDDGEAIVETIRALDPRIQVGGTTANIVDTVDSVVSRMPIALGIIAVTTLILLFLMTGSVIVPIKALVLNLLSLTATFGALVWGFQEGHLADLLGTTATGRLDVFTPILMFCVAFGLSMDYEVFLLARIKERYDLGADSKAAVVEGLDHTGGLVTAAALLLAMVFLAISTSGVAIVKMFGLGLALAVLVDAFLVRATLVPAFMAMAGRANWWAPAPLRRFHLRWGAWE